MRAHLARMTGLRPGPSKAAGVNGHAGGGVARQSVGVAAKPVKIDVEGMMCDGCSSRVQEMLDKNPAVVSSEVSWEKNLVVVELKATEGDEGALSLPVRGPGGPRPAHPAPPPPVVHPLPAPPSGPAEAEVKAEVTQLVGAIEDLGFDARAPSD